MSDELAVEAREAAVAHGSVVAARASLADKVGEKVASSVGGERQAWLDVRAALEAVGADLAVGGTKMHDIAARIEALENGGEE